jgi:hypothetical protein
MLLEVEMGYESRMGALEKVHLLSNDNGKNLSHSMHYSGNLLSITNSPVIEEIYDNSPTTSMKLIKQLTSQYLL